MNLVINADVLRRELFRRGLSAAALARAAGISRATVSAACAGNRVSPMTVRRIAKALATAPVLPDIDHLLL